MACNDPWHTRPTDEPQQAESTGKPRKRKHLPALLECVIELVLEIAAGIIDALT